MNETVDPATETAQQRETLSALRSLLVLAQLMMESTTEDQIIKLALGAAKSLAPASLVTIELGDQPERAGEQCDAMAEEVFPLHTGQGHVGWLVANFDREVPDEERFLLRSLAQHTGAAVANRRLHEQERWAASEAARANAQLQETVETLQNSIDIRARLNEVTSKGEGREGIARAVHDLTGVCVAVEDQFGNLTAWAGSEPPDPYPKESASSRERLIRRALRSAQPMQVGDRWIGVIRPQPDVVGALILIDPDGIVGEQHLTALEYGMTTLAMELARLRSLAESELRVRRDLVDELLSGTAEDSAIRRAQALHYDLQRPHRVVVVEGFGQSEDEDELLHAVRRSARDERVGTLLVRRAARVVVLADQDADWAQFRLSILKRFQGGCRLGIGELSETISDIPMSLRQAEIALRVQRAASWEDQATIYESLGVYQLLAEVEDPEATERYGRSWLELLLQYDEKRNADLVSTLSRYFECGGNYDATADALFIHRSTLKYRLGRIREITGYDLNDPDTRFSLQLACRAWVTVNALRGDAESPS